MGDRPRPGIEPQSPAPAGGCFTTELPGKSGFTSHRLVVVSMWCSSRWGRLPGRLSFRDPCWGYLPFLVSRRGAGNFRSSKCRFGSEVGFPSGRRGNGNGVEGGKSRIVLCVWSWALGCYLLRASGDLETSRCESRLRKGEASPPRDLAPELRRSGFHSRWSATRSFGITCRTLVSAW